MKRKTIVLSVLLLSLASCHRTTLDEQAGNMARDFTERYCPTPVTNNQRTDSVTFDPRSHTFTFYYALSGRADSPEAIARSGKELRRALLDELREDTNFKVYKDAGFSFRYVVRSSSKGNVLYDQTFTGKDYE